MDTLKPGEKSHETKAAEKDLASKPKMDATGVLKNPVTGKDAKAGESNPAVDKHANTAKSSDAVRAQNPPRDTRALDKNYSSIKGEILQGDSFQITLTRGDVELKIPVPMECQRDLVTLDNTFTIISKILEAGTRADLDETFAAYLVR